MLKGVASVPSPDLFHLWRSNQTLNSNVPLASHLTTEYFGHFKPDFSNHWKDYCIDQVMFSFSVDKAICHSSGLYYQPFIAMLYV